MLFPFVYSVLVSTTQILVVDNSIPNWCLEIDLKENKIEKNALQAL